MFVGFPMRDTEYNNRFSWPLGAPTIISTPDIVLLKLSFAFKRMCSTLSNTLMLINRERKVNTTDLRRLAKLLHAREINMVDFPAVCVVMTFQHLSRKNVVNTYRG